MEAGPFRDFICMVSILSRQLCIPFKKDFPNLDVNNISVTGEATGTYNCIAYSMGITIKWIDPESFYNDFIEQYKNAKTLYGSSLIMNRLVQKVAMLLLMVGEQVV